MSTDPTERICGAPTKSGTPCKRTPPPGQEHCYQHRDTAAEQSALMDALTSLEPGDAMAGIVGVVCGIYIAHDPAAYETVAELLLPVLAGGSLASRAAKSKRKGESVARRLPAWRSIRYLDAFVLMLFISYGAVVASHGKVPLLRALHELGLLP